MIDIEDTRRVKKEARLMNLSYPDVQTGNGKGGSERRLRIEEGGTTDD